MEDKILTVTIPENNGKELQLPIGQYTFSITTQEIAELKKELKDVPFDPNSPKNKALKQLEEELRNDYQCIIGYSSKCKIVSL